MSDAAKQNTIWSFVAIDTQLATTRSVIIGDARRTGNNFPPAIIIKINDGKC